MFGIEGALRMPAFQLPPGQTYTARFEIWAGPKIYHRLARLDHNEAEIMDFGIFKIVSQFLLNFLNWLHGFSVPTAGRFSPSPPSSRSCSGRCRAKPTRRCADVAV